jgi:tetratricopeptide (TPR) repeat protein
MLGLWQGLVIREMYADMLYSLGRPEDALIQYKSDLRLSPNRFNGLAGAGRAAAKAGHTEEARSYSTQLFRITKGGSDSTRPEILAARKLIVEPRNAGSHN